MKSPLKDHELGTIENGNTSIWQQWVTYSFAIDKSFPLQFLLPHIHGLGMLDASIRLWETKNLENPSAPKNASESSIMECSYWYFLSHQWVLGAYEVVRTLAEKGKKKKRQKANEERIFGKETYRKIVETRDLLAEARIPLAKLRPKANGQTAIPFPVIFPGDGFGWRITIDESRPGKEISRRELADAVLELLKFIYDNESVVEKSIVME